MINEIMQIDDEDEARRILMKLGNGLTQVDAYIAEWKAAKAPKPAPAPVKQKVVSATSVEAVAPVKPKTTIVTK